MTFRIASILFAPLLALATAQEPAGPAGEAAPPRLPRVRSSHTFPALRLGAALQQALGGEVGGDRGILLAAGSDLWRGPTDGSDEFWMLTDRGPNGLVTVDRAVRRTFPMPVFTPLLVRVRAAADELEVLELVAVKGASGRPVTGLANLPGHDEPPFDARGEQRLPFEPGGLDPEGFVRRRDGSFWIAEEYGPSLVEVAADGVVQRRLVPAGLQLGGTDYPVADSLPAIFARRKDNRGFESLAIGRDERILYAALQSPLSVPDKKTGDASRQVRIVAVDAASGSPVAEYVYRLEPAAAFDPAGKTAPADLKISALAVIDGGGLLVLERTDTIARVYAVDLATGTNVLGTAWDDPATAPALEALDDPAEREVQVLQKHLVVDLTALPGIAGKIEGLAVVDARTLAVTNDNDFDVGTIGQDGQNQGAGVRCRIWLVDLTAPLF